MATHHTALAAADVVDPVCGMTIDPDDAVGDVRCDGQVYYFCNPSCLERFQADPKRFFQPARREPITAAELDAEYICPMDPDVRSP